MTHSVNMTGVSPEDQEAIKKALRKNVKKSAEATEVPSKSIYVEKVEREIAERMAKKPPIQQRTTKQEAKAPELPLQQPPRKRLLRSKHPRHLTPIVKVVEIKVRKKHERKVQKKRPPLHTRPLDETELKIKRRYMGLKNPDVDLETFLQWYKAGMDTCTYCKRPIPSINKSALDHVVPKAKGGSDKLENLTVACRICNHAKNDMTREDFLDWLHGRDQA